MKRRTSPELSARRSALARRVFPPGPGHPASKYDRAVRDLVATMYRAQIPVKLIMAEIGCSRDTVNRYVRAAGLEKRRKPARYDEARFAPGWKLVNGRPVYTGN